MIIPTPLQRVLVACALAALLAGGPGPAAAQEETPPPPPAAPDTINNPTNLRPGVYYMDYGSYAWDPDQYPVDGAMRVYSWQELNPSDGVYRWDLLDQWISDRKALGLATGLMLSVYDGDGSGDIRSTPDYVIKAPDAVVPVSTNDANKTPLYVNFWKRSNYNSNFEYSPHDYGWKTSGNVSIVSGAPSNGTYAAKLGGVNNATGYLYHYEQRSPAMPASLNGTKRIYVTASVYISTSDGGANDHLYMELWDTSNQRMGGTTLDITNLSHANNSWKTYEFDVSGFAPETLGRVAFRVTTSGSNVTTFYVDNLSFNGRHLIPRYQNASYSDPYARFIEALGAYYKSNPDFQFISMGTGVYGENQPTQDNYDYAVEAGGLTTANWTAYINKMTDAHANGFSVGAGLPPGRSVMLQYAPTYKLSQEREDTTDHAGSKKVGLSANFLSPDKDQAYRNDGTGMYDPLHKFAGQVPVSFESYLMDLCNPVLQFWAYAFAADKRVDYLRAESALFRNGDGSLGPAAPFLSWVQQYVGRTAATTPRVWSMMREHRNPVTMNCRPGGVVYFNSSTGSPWPDFGNFEFYLTQKDSITGGKTVAETNDKGADSRYAKDPSTGAARPDAGLGNCPAKTYREDLFGPNYPCFKEPYNPNLPPLVGQNPDDYTDYYVLGDWTGEGREAYSVRRTDQATGNPYMFFLIDDGYILGTTTTEATITVKYFDIGTDRFSVKYHSTSGEKTAGTVVKTGSRILKTATFTVTDGRFGNGLAGASDLYIDSRNGTTNDGNEWIHMVEVEKRQGPASPLVVASASGANVTLTWAAVTRDAAGNPITVSRYDVWRNAAPYFTPGGTPAGQVTGMTWTDSGAVSANDARYYLVTAVDSSGRQGNPSNRTGKFSFGLIKGAQ